MTTWTVDIHFLDSDWDEVSSTRVTGLTPEAAQDVLASIVKTFMKTLHLTTPQGIPMRKPEFLMMEVHRA